MVDQTTLERAEGGAVTIEGWGGRPAQSYWSESWERLRGNRFGMTFGVLLLILAVIALVAPLVSQFISHYQPSDTQLSNTFQGVTRQHLLGTDELGRDTFTRLIWGARVSLGIGFLTVLLHIGIGGAAGRVP